MQISDSRAAVSVKTLAKYMKIRLNQCRPKLPAQLITSCNLLLNPPFSLITHKPQIQVNKLHKFLSIPVNVIFGSNGIQWVIRKAGTQKTVPHSCLCH